MIEQIAAGELGTKLRSQVVAWHPGATRDEMDEAFQEACVLAQRSCQGQSEGEVYSWLRTTTSRELGHLRRRRSRRSQRELVADAASLETSECEPSPEERLIDWEDWDELAHLTRALLAPLSEPQRAVAALYSHGRKRPEIADDLGMSPRSVKRTLELVMMVGRAELVRLAGSGCASGEPLVARFAFGLASPREVQKAELHLATCSRCNALYARLDLWRDQVAAILPVPAVEQAHPCMIEGAVRAAADAGARLVHRVRGSLLGVREQVGDAAAQAKQQAASAYARVADPTPLVGVRPGAAAAAIVGCLAVGGGATYCAKQGVDPIAGLSSVVAADHAKAVRAKPKKAHAKKARQAQIPSLPAPGATATTTTPAAAPAPTPTEPASQQPAPTTTPAQTSAPATATVSEPAPAPQDEYEPVSAQSASAPTTSPTPAPSEPAPAPAGGPGEFGGP